MTCTSVWLCSKQKRHNAPATAVFVQWADARPYFERDAIQRHLETEGEWPNYGTRWWFETRREVTP